MSFLKDFKDLRKDIAMSMDDSEAEERERLQAVADTQVFVDSPVSEKPQRKTEGNLHPDGASVIAEGTVIEGNLVSDGSIAVYGTVRGNIKCDRKLIVTGEVIGDLNGGEIFINRAKIDGEVVSEGNLKIGNASVIIGDIYGKTAVIAGAIKGEIDIRGPVIIDNTAVIKGNIRSASVQINNGAVIEGFCTQCYHDVDINSIFDDTFPESVRTAKTEQAGETESAQQEFATQPMTDADYADQNFGMQDFQEPYEGQLPDIEEPVQQDEEQLPNIEEQIPNFSEESPIEAIGGGFDLESLVAAADSVTEEE